MDAVRGQIETIIGQGQQPPSGHIRFTPRAKKVLELSLRQALKLNHRHIDTGTCCSALISKDDCVAVQVLDGLGTDLEQLRARVISEIVDDPEDRDDSPPLRLSHARLHDPVQDLLAEIDDRLSAIEVHLGITRPFLTRGRPSRWSSTRPENVVPPS